MGRKADAVVNGVNMTMKIMVSLLWGAGAVGAFATGHIFVGLIAVAYLVYLWIFDGRWLIY